MVLGSIVLDLLNKLKLGGAVVLMLPGKRFSEHHGLISATFGLNGPFVINCLKIAGRYTLLIWLQKSFKVWEKRRCLYIQCYNFGRGSLSKRYSNAYTMCFIFCTLSHFVQQTRSQANVLDQKLIIVTDLLFSGYIYYIHQTTCTRGVQLIMNHNKTH